MGALGWSLDESMTSSKVELRPRGVLLRGEPLVGGLLPPVSALARLPAMGGLEKLPKCASTENYASQVVVQLAEVREAQKRRSLTELRTDQAARQEAQAAEWRKALASGEVGSRAALARREGVSRAWVTKVLGRSPTLPGGDRARLARQGAP